MDLVAAALFVASIVGFVGIPAVVLMRKYPA